MIDAHRWGEVGKVQRLKVMTTGITKHYIIARFYQSGFINSKKNL
jgi:hypothetical protein